MDLKKANPTSSAVGKGLFPRILKKQFDVLGEERMRKNAISGFSVCGIYPFNKQELLEKLTVYIEDGNENANERGSVNLTLLEYLKKMQQTKKKDSVSTKKRQLNIVPGRSVAAEDTPTIDDSCLSKANSSAVQKITTSLCKDRSSSSSSGEECDKTRRLNKRQIKDFQCFYIQELF